MIAFLLNGPYATQLMAVPPYTSCVKVSRPLDPSTMFRVPDVGAAAMPVELDTGLYVITRRTPRGGLFEWRGWESERKRG